MDRKEFIKTAGIGSFSLFNISKVDVFLKQSEIRLGLITNIIEKELKQDWKKALLRVSQAGYQFLEFYAINDLPREIIRDYLKQIGIKPLSGGNAIAAFKKDNEFKKMIDDALFYEKEYLICYWPWMDNGDNKHKDDFLRVSEELNKIGEKCKANGLRFAFHNHNKEFIKVADDCWGYEIILQKTDPSSVCMLLDLYWAKKGGADIVSLFEHYPGRFEMLHIKDMDNTPQKGMTCPGNGIIDFKRIFKHAKKAGVKYFIVEVDQYPDAFRCINESCAYLKKIKIG